MPSYEYGYMQDHLFPSSQHRIQLSTLPVLTEELPRALTSKLFHIQKIARNLMNRKTSNCSPFPLPILKCLSVSLAVLAFGILSRASDRLNLLSSHFSSLPLSPSRFFAARSTMAYSKELRTASLAVQRATILTQKVFHDKVKGTVSKDDKSPVTIGDFGAQALIIQAIKHNFPDDGIVGEEESSSLRENQSLIEMIWELVKGSKLESGADEELGGTLQSANEMLAAIDLGNSGGGSTGRFWALDPIDGTKGFLRGGQYAVCLALIVDGEVEVGVIGCPNLPVDDAAPLSADIDSHEQHQRGVLFAAVRGHGASSQPLGTGDLLPGGPIHMKSPAIPDASFCESVEAGHSSHGDQAAIAQALGISRPSVRMDSQAKYGSIARGAGDLYLRLPVSETYVEKIWDHAAGDLIVREAGGAVTDIVGNRLDFSVGRMLHNNKGVVAAPKALHGEVLSAVKSVLGRRE